MCAELHVEAAVVIPGAGHLLPLLPEPVLGGLLLLDPLLEVPLEGKHFTSHN